MIKIKNFLNKKNKSKISVFSNFQNCIGLIHKVYNSELKNSRNYTASTKTKSEVRGGGRKPWKQKGTGQARAGSIRSPLWVGGGVIFGPKPRIVFKKANKKEKVLAINYAISFKKLIFLNDDEISNILHFSILKTKNLFNFLLLRSINPKSRILFISDKPNINLWQISRNLKNIKVTTLNCINLELVLNSEYILFFAQNKLKNLIIK